MLATLARPISVSSKLGSPTNSISAFPEMSKINSFRGKSMSTNLSDSVGNRSQLSTGSTSPDGKKNGKKWFTTLNPTNTLINNEEIQRILAKGKITLPIKDIDIWQRAFVHKSYIVKKSNSEKNQDSISPDDSPRSSSSPVQDMLPLQEKSNERLEWLGDAQLQSAVTEYLFRRYPGEDEGFLTKLRSKLVKTNNLCFLATKLGFSPHLIISYHVEFGCNGRNNKKILENTFEAFIGAMFIDFSHQKEKPNYAFGSEVVRHFVINVIERYVDIAEMISKDDNYKDSLMWFFQKNFSGTYPIYQKEKFENNCFYIYVEEPGTTKVVGRGSGRSKKQAEQLAAKDALQYYAKKRNVKDKLKRSNQSDHL